MSKAKLDLIKRLEQAEKAMKNPSTRFNRDNVTALLIREAREVIQRFSDTLAITEMQLRIALRYNQEMEQAHANADRKRVSKGTKKSAGPIRGGGNRGSQAVPSK